jgi:hypothetical protein
MSAGGCCGLPPGALAGFAATLRIAREGNEDWSMIVWTGVALGVAVGPASCSFGVAQAPSGVAQAPFDLMNMLIAAVVTAMFGTVGGMLAATGDGLWRRVSTGRSQFNTTVLGRLFALTDDRRDESSPWPGFSGQGTGVGECNRSSEELATSRSSVAVSGTEKSQ